MVKPIGVEYFTLLAHIGYDYAAAVLPSKILGHSAVDKKHTGEYLVGFSLSAAQQCTVAYL